jgi:RNA-directed DNA polymerase
LGNLATPENIQKLQTALHAKAKGEPGFRFYSLYDKVHRRDVLEYAYACCRANQGAAGVDGERFEDIETYGVERWLGELADTLRKKTYRPQALRRVYVPKPNGKLRPLSIPTIRDRTAMMATTLILAPIFEADLPREQHGYRPERSALSAVQETRDLLVTGRTQVVDADLTDYFGSIPHAQLMTSVARRVVDRQILHLLKMWLEAPVDETDDQGRTRRTTRNKDSKRGIPQGSPTRIRLMCADCRKDGSTFWVTLSNGATRKRRADPIWGRVRQRRVSSAWSSRSIRKPSEGHCVWTPTSWSRD